VNHLVSILFVLFAAQQIPQLTDKVVVTASDIPESVATTPASVTVITKKEIDERQARDVADVLREVPGLQLAQSGSPGKQTSLFTRGAASTQTLVLWNGIEINNPNFSGYDWGRFSTAGVEQVEVVRGPFSALYGSEAMAGVVNVLTNPRKSGWQASVESGSHGWRNALFDGAFVGETTAGNLAFEKRDDDGFNPNDDFSQTSSTGSWTWRPSKTFSLGAAARHTSYDFGIPFNTNFLGDLIVPSLQRRQKGHETQLALPVSFTLGTVVNQLTLSNSKRSDDFSDPEDPYGFVASTTDSSRRRARFTSRFATGIGTIVGGAEYERLNVTDASNFGTNFQDGRRTNHSFFVEDRWSHEGFELSAGVRRDSFGRFGTETSPRLAFAFVSGGSKWRAAYGEGFRAPSIGELYFPFSGNPDLRAERSRTFEFGWDGGFADGILSATYFNNHYRDLIEFDPATFVNVNIGRVKSDGVELGFDHQVGANFHTALSYTYLHKNEDEDTGLRLLRRPKHSGSLFFGYRNGAVESSVVFLRNGEREDILPTFPYSRTTNGGYTNVNATMQWHMKRFVPFVRIENVRNAHYQEVLGYDAPSRRTIVGVKFGM
jgi:vitamin B12 transporter